MVRYTVLWCSGSMSDSDCIKFWRLRVCHSRFRNRLLTMKKDQPRIEPLWKFLPFIGQGLITMHWLKLYLNILPYADVEQGLRWPIGTSRANSHLAQNEKCQRPPKAIYIRIAKQNGYILSVLRVRGAHCIWWSDIVVAGGRVGSGFTIPRAILR